MTSTRPPVDPDGLMEFSVVFTDRSLNHMSKIFQGVMNDISSTLCEVYKADAAVVVPGGGTYAMEAVARQFATGKKAMVVRNGWFSYRWTQVFEAGNIPADTEVLRAHQLGNDLPAPFAPQPVEEAAKCIGDFKPDIIFAPHVETSSGVMLPDDYIEAVAGAAHANGALFALNCIASGAVWIDMKALGVDILISAPQKGWSASPAAGLVMLNRSAVDAMQETQSTSFAADLKKWHDIMQAYLNGGHAYHAAMPTDALTIFRDTMLETREIGFDTLREHQFELGRRVRSLLESRGYKSVAARGFESPGVVVSYTSDGDIQNGKKFAACGMQIAAGVPLMCNEPDDFTTFRLGLFGLDKLQDIDGTVAKLETVLDRIREV